MSAVGLRPLPAPERQTTIDARAPYHGHQHGWSQDDAAKSREELLAELAYLRMENAYLKNWRP